MYLYIIKIKLILIIPLIIKTITKINFKIIIYNIFQYLKRY